MANVVSGNTVSSSAQLGTDVVTNPAMANDSVDKTNIATGAVGTDEILDGEIVNADISTSAAIALSKLASGTQGGVMFRTTAGVMTELAAGTAGKVLQTNGAGADPTWVTTSGSKIDFLTTPISFTTSTAENTLFTSSIPANKLGTANGVRIKLYITNVTSFNTESFAIRIKLGGSTVTTVTCGGGGNINGPAYIEFTVIEAGTTSSQRWVCNSTTPNTYLSSGTGTLALDDTASIAIAVTSQLSVSGGSENITLSAAVVEAII